MGLSHSYVLFTDVRSLNISSCGADRPRQGLVWYNATKGAVSNATKGLALEYGPQKIRVNSICPLLSGTGLYVRKPPIISSTTDKIQV